MWVGLAQIAGTVIAFAGVVPSAAGTGPPVGNAFAAVTFDADGMSEVVFVAWRDPQEVRSGLLRLDDGSFQEFPAQPVAYLTNLTVGVGGPSSDRRAFMLWVGSQLELARAVFDASGNVVGPPATIANAVQVVPVRMAPTDAGALASLSWDANSYWDPRVVSMDLNGALRSERVAEAVALPEQALGVTVVAAPNEVHAIAYIVSDTHEARIRRFDASGPLDPTPVRVFGNAGGDYLPHAALFAPATEDPFLLLFLPEQLPSGTNDLRLAHTTLTAGPVTVGPRLSELSPTFPGGVADVAVLTGVSDLAVVVWQEIEYQDPDVCLCTVPPPIRIEFRAQLVRAGVSPQAVGDPFSVHLWETGDLVGPPRTAPVIATSARTPGRFTVLWSDGLLRYAVFDGSTPVPVDPFPLALRPVTLSIAPNPFTPRTTVRYAVPSLGRLRLTVFDVRGRYVAQLAEGTREPGYHVVNWDGRDVRGREASAGVYLIRIDHEAGSSVATAIKLR